MEDLIVNVSALFDERSSNPTLPLPPSGEPPESYGYGSSFTQVATVTSNNHDITNTNDFSPTLPSHPSCSIHPSRRANNQLNRDDESSPESNERASLQGSVYSSHMPMGDTDASEATAFD